MAKISDINLNNFVQVFLGANTQLTLNETETSAVNLPKDTFYLVANIPIALVKG